MLEKVSRLILFLVFCLNRCLTQNIDLGDFIEGTKLVINNEAVSGYKEVDECMSWNSSKIEAFSIISNLTYQKLASKITLPSGRQSEEIVFADYHTKNKVIRILYKVKDSSGNDLLFFQPPDGSPNFNAPINKPNGFTCDVYNQNNVMYNFNYLCYKNDVYNYTFNVIDQNNRTDPICFDLWKNAETNGSLCHINSTYNDQTPELPNATQNTSNTTSNTTNNTSNVTRFENRTKVVHFNTTRAVTQLFAARNFSNLVVNMHDSTTFMPVMSGFSEIFSVNYSSQASQSNSNPDFVPQESSSLNKVYNDTALKQVVEFVWNKPKPNVIYTNQEINNTEIILLWTKLNPSNASQTVVDKFLVNPTFQGGYTYRIIHDVRSIYEVTTSTTILLMYGILNTTNISINSNCNFSICYVTFSTKSINCKLVQNSSLSEAYLIKNIHYRSDSKYDVFLNLKANPTDVPLVGSITTDANNVSTLSGFVVTKYSNYPSHNIADFWFNGYSVYKGNDKSTLAFSGAHYHNRSSFYAVNTSWHRLNPGSGFLFNDSQGFYRMLLKSQNETNYYIPGGTAGDYEYYQLNSSLRNLSNPILKTVRLRYLNPTGFVSLGVNESPLNKSCFNLKPCFLPHTPSKFAKFAPSFAFSGHFNDAAPNLVARKVIHSIDSPRTLTVIGPFVISPNLKDTLPDNGVNVSAIVFKVYKCSISNAVYQDIYYCNHAPLPEFNAVQSQFRFKFLQKYPATFFVRSNYLYITHCSVGQGGEFSITMRYPQESQSLKILPSTETGPYESSSLIFDRQSVSAFFANLNNSGVITSKVYFVLQNSFTHNKVTGFVNFEKEATVALPTAINRLVLHRNSQNSSVYYVSYLTLEQYGFVVGRQKVQVGSSISITNTFSNQIRFNDMEFPANLGTTYYCGSETSFMAFLPKYKFVYGTWENSNSVNNLPPFLAEDIRFIDYDILQFSCINEIDGAILVLKKGNDVILVVYNLKNVSNPIDFIVLQQVLPFNVNNYDPLTSDLNYYDNKIYIKKDDGQVFSYNLNLFDLMFRVKTANVKLTMNYDYKGSTQTLSKDISLNIEQEEPNGTLKEFNPKEQYTPNTSLNLTTQKNHTTPQIFNFDEKLEVTGHLWDMLISKSYVSSLASFVSTRLKPKKWTSLDSLPPIEQTPAMGSGTISHAKFASLNLLSIIMRNIYLNFTMIEVRLLNTELTSRKFTLNLSNNCFDVSMISSTSESRNVTINSTATNYTAFLFTAVLHCQRLEGVYFYAIVGELTRRTIEGDENSALINQTYKHFEFRPTDTTTDQSSSKWTVVQSAPFETGTGELFLSARDAASKKAAVYYFSATPLPSSNPIPLGSAKANFPKSLGEMTNCNLVKYPKPSIISICSNYYTGNVLFTIFDINGTQLLNVSQALPNKIIPLTQTCTVVYFLVSATPVLRCAFSTNVEIHMIDFYVNDTTVVTIANYSTISPLSNVFASAITSAPPNPRIFKLVGNYLPQSIAINKNFLAIIAKPYDSEDQKTNSALMVYHIDNQDLQNYGNVGKFNNFMYAGTYLDQGTVTYESVVCPMLITEKITNITTNYFVYQKYDGTLTTFQVDRFKLSLSFNASTLNLMGDTSIAPKVDTEGALPPAGVNATYKLIDFYTNPSAQNSSNNTTPNQTISAAPQKASTAIYWYVGAGVVAAALLGAAAFFILSKPAKMVTSLGIELRYESGVLKL